jgi:hypothetical protein
MIRNREVINLILDFLMRNDAVMLTHLMERSHDHKWALAVVADPDPIRPPQTQLIRGDSSFVCRTNSSLRQATKYQTPRSMTCHKSARTERTFSRDFSRKNVGEIPFYC